MSPRRVCSSPAGASSAAQRADGHVLHVLRKASANVQRSADPLAHDASVNHVAEQSTVPPRVQSEPTLAWYLRRDALRAGASAAIIVAFIGVGSVLTRSTDADAEAVAVAEAPRPTRIVRDLPLTTSAPVERATSASSSATTAPPTATAPPATTTTAPVPTTTPTTPPPTATPAPQTTSVPTTAPPPPTTAAPPSTTAPPPPPAPPTTVAAAAGCHPSYSPCVPVASDVDCEGGSGNGPAYTGRVSVIGPDEYDLDRDGDGTGCD